MGESAVPSSAAPLNVLHVCAGNLFGGVERFLITLWEQRALCPEMRPQFAVCYEGELSRRLRALGADVENIGPARFARPWTLWATRRRVKRVIAKRSVDVTVSHGCWPHAVLQAATGVRAIFMHDTVRGMHWLERRAMAVPTHLALANSRFTAGQLPGGAFCGADVATVYLPSPRVTSSTAPSTRATLRSALDTCDGAVVIIMACRWEPYKGHLILLRALAQLKKPVPWNMWIAGGPQRPQEVAFQQSVLDEARRCGIDSRLRLLGQRSDVSSLLAAADIHCQPNLAPEPFGLTFVEALDAGLTVITTNHGGGAEILSPDFGLLTPPGDANALANALTRAIESKALRDDFASRGPARARELCDPARQLPALYDLLRRAHDVAHRC
ncbi:MAG TPA: glycosyltransferase [Tepidisphaeraceae bacterium]|nr:glycosyltransferase [Tepidisphaeraceae bacterium]